MIEKLKWYLVEIGIKKYGPVGVMAGIGMLGTFMAAHAGMLEQWGVTYGTWPLTWATGQAPSGQVILIELDTTSQAIIALVASLAAMAIRAGQHHISSTTALPGGMRSLKKLVMLLTILVISPIWCHGWSPVADIQDNLKWTLGEQAALGTAYKIGGSGDVKIGERGDSAMLGIFDYRFVKMSYGAITNPRNGSKVGDGLKAGLMLNYFLGWFKSPQTPAMQLLNNINIGPTVTIPLLTDSQPLKHPSVWVEANYQFGK